MDRNGYNPSIIPTQDGVCFLCGREVQTVRHEIYPGTGTRTLCKRYGVWVNLCPRCHDIVHADQDGRDNRELRKVARLMWVRHVDCEDEFIRIFIKGDIKNWEIKE